MVIHSGNHTLGKENTWKLKSHFYYSGTQGIPVIHVKVGTHSNK